MLIFFAEWISKKYLMPQNPTNIWRVNIFVYKNLNIWIYSNIYNVKTQKFSEWMSEYICGPIIKQIFWRMNILVNNYSNIYSNIRIFATHWHKRVAATFSPLVHPWTGPGCRLVLAAEVAIAVVVAAVAAVAASSGWTHI